MEYRRGHLERMDIGAQWDQMEDRRGRFKIATRRTTSARVPCAHGNNGTPPDFGICRELWNLP